MSKVCAICGKKPSFGNNRSHSMVATKRRFDPNLQSVRADRSTARRPVPTSARAASRPARSSRPSSRAWPPMARHGCRLTSAPWITSCGRPSVRSCISPSTRSGRRHDTVVDRLSLAQIVGHVRRELRRRRHAGPAAARLREPRLDDGVTVKRRRRRSRDRPARSIVEYGLNLAEVAATCARA